MKKRDLSRPLFCLAVFLFMLLFFVYAHPIVLYDSTDWQYTVFTRSLPLPLWGGQNPSCVFPETFMPLCNALGQFIFYPLTQDYPRAASFMFAFVLSICITAYTMLFCLFLERRMGISRPLSLWSTAWFLLFHFLAFRATDTQNEHLFFASDAADLFFYTIPTLLNFCLIFLFECYPQLLTRQRGHSLRKIVLLVVLYFAIFSHVFSSCLLGFWAVTQLLRRFLEYFLQEEHTLQKALLRTLQNGLWLTGMFVAWLVSLIFAFSGDPFCSAIVTDFKHNFLTSLHLLRVLPFSMNRVFLMFVIGTALLFVLHIIHCCRCKQPLPELTFLGFAAINFVLVALFLAWLCAKSNPLYMGYTQVLLAPMGWILAMGCCFLAYYAEHHPMTRIAVPLLTTFVFFSINTGYVTFKDSNRDNLNWQVCHAVSTQIVEQYKFADADGLTFLTLRMPTQFPCESFPTHAVSDAMYQYGITSRYIPSRMVGAPEVDRAVGLF